jgi:hypothetical protein
MIALYVVPVRVLAAERLVDISGTYSESGMTIRTSPGTPSEYVTLCGLFSLDLAPDTHKVGAELGNQVTITQHGDLAVEFVTHGGRLPDRTVAGICHGTRTKADGLQVNERTLTIPRGPLKASKELWRALYQFSLDEESRLIFYAELNSTKMP